MARAKPAPAPQHDHEACVERARSRAERAMAEKGLKLTDHRRQVLDEVVGSHIAVGAYQILDRLAEKGLRLQPMAVYRALEALEEAGLVHHLAARNAYFACHAAHDPGRDQLVFVCSTCANVTEVEAAGVFRQVDAVAAGKEFKREGHLIEIVGACRTCREQRQPL